MTADDTTRRAAEVMAAALAGGADVDLFGGYTDTDDLNDSVLDSRYSLIAVARALAEEGLLAPAPLHVVTATNQFGESHRRWATEWLPVDRAEGDGRAEP